MAEAASTEWSGEICPSYPAGVRFLRSGEVLKILLNRLRGKQNRAASLGQALAQIGRGTRPASLDWSDPLPRVGKLLSELADLATSDDSGSAGNRGD
jgi:hypothetical protein